jgi:hypothetical protein
MDRSATPSSCDCSDAGNKVTCYISGQCVVACNRACSWMWPGMASCQELTGNVGNTKLLQLQVGVWQGRGVTVTAVVVTATGRAPCWGTQWTCQPHPAPADASICKADQIRYVYDRGCCDSCCLPLPFVDLRSSVVYVDTSTYISQSFGVTGVQRTCMRVC